jgi:hypothetical protein
LINDERVVIVGKKYRLEDIWIQFRTLGIQDLIDPTIVASDEEP